MKNRNNFTLASFGWRFLSAFVLVFLSYNPSGFSWVHWLNSDAALVYKVLFGTVLLIGWVGLPDSARTL